MQSFDFDIDLSCYVINLARMNERRNTISQQLRDNKIKFSIINGIDGNDEQQHDLYHNLQERFSYRMMRYITPTEIACSISHRLAIENFLQSTSAYGLILEDDATFELDFKSKVSELLVNCPGYDVYKVGSINPRFVRGIELYRNERFVAVHVYSSSVCAHAYIVSRDGASKLLNNLEPINEPFDAYLRDGFRHKATCCEVIPTFSKPREDHIISSNIEKARVSQRKIHYSLSFLANYVAFRSYLYIGRIIYSLRQHGIKNTALRKEVFFVEK